MTTANISLAFARQGNKVGVLDVDLNGPCIPKMLGVKDRFEFTSEGAIPPVGPYEMKVASMDFFLRQEDSPVRWKGPMELSPVWLGLMEMNVIREFLGDVNWGEIDYLFTDLPRRRRRQAAGHRRLYPGAGRRGRRHHPFRSRQNRRQKSIVYARDLGIPIIGLVENMSGALCPNCSTAVPFFEGGCEDLCEELDVPLLGKIPSTANCRTRVTRASRSRRRIRFRSGSMRSPTGFNSSWIIKRSLPKNCSVPQNL